MAEVFLLRTEGGPHPGVRVCTKEGSPGVWGWPLPGVLEDDGGAYEKVSESDLEPQPEESSLKRGALYEWRPDA